MSKDGPETGNIAERLKAKSAADTKVLEDAIRRAHRQLATNLQQSSRAALKQCAQSLDHEISQIETQVTQSAARMMSRLGEIEINPARTMRKTAVIAALIGAGMAMLPWALMSWLEMSVTEEAGSAIKRWGMIREETERLNAMSQIKVVRGGGETALMLPMGTTEILFCGPEGRPCIRLGN